MRDLWETRVALETGTYLSDLVVTNPAHSDGLNAADAHMRLIKATAKNTFPNLTGAVTATQADLNGVAALTTTVNTTGVSMVADAGVFFKTSGDGFVNTLAGDIDVKLQGTIAATFQRTGGANFFKSNGNIEAVGGTLKGGGMAPIGSIIIWPSNTLPPTDEGVWAWCNGSTASRTTYATAYARLGTTYGAGDGSTTFTLPDYREVVLTGRATMGGAAGRNILNFTNTIKDTLSAWFGEALHVITGGELPAHRHGAYLIDPGHTHGGVLVSTNSYSSPGGATAVTQSANGGATASSLTGATVHATDDNALNATSVTGASNPMSLVQPTQPTNYIIRLA